MNQVVDFINVNRDRYVDELKQYLAIPSISALPEHAGDVRRAAEWTADAITARVYRALPEKRLPMAKQGVLSHLVKLEREGRARRDGEAWHIMGA